MFIKYFDKKKSIKKNKNTKLLIARFLRKLFILIKFNNILFIVKNNPLFFNDFLIFLNTQIPYKFLDPNKKDLIDDEKINNLFFIKINNIFFIKNFNFSKNKTKKIGRVKRKIKRKIIINNKITD